MDKLNCKLVDKIGKIYFASKELKESRTEEINLPFFYISLGFFESKMC